MSDSPARGTICTLSISLFYLSTHFAFSISFDITSPILSTQFLSVSLLPTSVLIRSPRKLSYCIIVSRFFRCHFERLAFMSLRFRNLVLTTQQISSLLVVFIPT